MRSSSGEHYIALDHVRALAAFMVFTWHFTHGFSGSPIPFSYVPSLFIFSPLDEGHTGVALFMTLSGYLFAKLLDGKRINYLAFMWNRVLRLLPLLVVVVLAVGIQHYLSGEEIVHYLRTIASGAISPTLPNGGWSITVEFHFYLLLPFILWIVRKSKLWLFVILLGALILRLKLHHDRGDMIQYFSYWTIIGRLDQFICGVLLFEYRDLLTRRHVVVAAMVTAFSLFYWYFDALGGLSLYPPTGALWVFLPTLEGLVYASLVAYYDCSFSPPTHGISRFVSRIGSYSYSIYLLHFFVVFSVAEFIGQYFDLSGFFTACCWSLVCFLLMVPVGHLSYRFIESPFLSFRKRYV